MKEFSSAMSPQSHPEKSGIPDFQGDSAETKFPKPGLRKKTKKKYKKSPPENRGTFSVKKYQLTSFFLFLWV